MQPRREGELGPSSDVATSIEGGNLDPYHSQVWGSANSGTHGKPSPHGGSSPAEDAHISFEHHGGIQIAGRSAEKQVFGPGYFGLWVALVILVSSFMAPMLMMKGLLYLSSQYPLCVFLPSYSTPDSSPCHSSRVSRGTQGTPD